jgi:hypothetical protein
MSAGMRTGAKAAAASFRCIVEQCAHWRRSTLAGMSSMSARDSGRRGIRESRPPHGACLLPDRAAQKRAPRTRTPGPEPCRPSPWPLRCRRDCQRTRESRQEPQQQIVPPTITYANLLCDGALPAWRQMQTWRLLTSPLYMRPSHVVDGQWAPRDQPGSRPDEAGLIRGRRTAPAGRPSPFPPSSPACF